MNAPSGKARTTVLRRSLVRAMSPAMRRIALVLATVSLLLVFVSAGTLVTLGTRSLATDGGARVVTIEGQGGESIPDEDVPLAAPGAERIDDEDVPLSSGVAEPGLHEGSSGEFPFFIAFGAVAGAAVTFFLVHLRKVNASITAMREKMRP